VLYKRRIHTISIKGVFIWAEVSWNNGGVRGVSQLVEHSYHSRVFETHVQWSSNGDMWTFSCSLFTRSASFNKLFYPFRISHSRVGYIHHLKSCLVFQGLRAAAGSAKCLSCLCSSSPLLRSLLPFLGFGGQIRARVSNKQRLLEWLRGTKFIFFLLLVHGPTTFAALKTYVLTSTSNAPIPTESGKK